MTGHGGPDTDLRGFRIADLSNHDDVGILAEEGTEGPRVVEADPFLDFQLVDA